MRRADELVVGDVIADLFLPRAFYRSPGEVLYVRVHDLAGQGGRWVFVAYVLDDGNCESVTFMPDAQLLVTPAGPVGQDYSRGDEGEQPQPVAGRMPAHFADGQTGVEIDDPAVRCDTDCTCRVEDLRETVHWRISDLIDLVIACGAESGPFTAVREKVTCAACIEAHAGIGGVSCQGAPAGYEADCGTPGPHGAHGPEPVGVAKEAVEPVTVYFSFGHGQTDPDTGEDLLFHYVTIVGPSYEACRAAMFNSRFGDRWSFDYLAGTPMAREWIPRWIEHERIDAMPRSEF